MLESPRISFPSLQVCPRCGVVGCVCETLHQSTAQRIQRSEESVQKAGQGAYKEQQSGSERTSEQATNLNSVTARDREVRSHEQATGTQTGKIRQTEVSASSSGQGVFVASKAAGMETVAQMVLLENTRNMGTDTDTTATSDSHSENKNSRLRQKALEGYGRQAAGFFGTETSSGQLSRMV